MARTFCITLFTLTVLSICSWSYAQDLNVNGLSSNVPTDWQLPAGAQPAPASSNTPQFGYQFQFGSFTVQPGSPPTVDGIFVLTTQQFPQGNVEKLYKTELTYVGSDPQGAVFTATVNGSVRYFQFGVTSSSSQNGVPLRNLYYYNSSGKRTYSTLARFYAP